MYVGGGMRGGGVIYVILNLPDPTLVLITKLGIPIPFSLGISNSMIRLPCRQLSQDTVFSFHVRFYLLLESTVHISPLLNIYDLRRNYG